MIEKPEASRKILTGTADDAPAEPREAYGFIRTRCDCVICKIPCRHIPGGLDVPDLLKLCPPDQDVFAWAEQHLRALSDKPVPALVPARQANGHCHWYYDGKCLVHTNSPYGCAYFDTHMPTEEERKRYDAMTRSRQADADANGLYTRVWRHLRDKGLIADTGNREAMNDQIRKTYRTAQRRWREL